MRITESRLRQIVNAAVKDAILMEGIDNQMEQENIRQQLAQEILGTNSFEEFYKNTGMMVNPRDYYLMSEYFRRLGEAESQIQRK